MDSPALPIVLFTILTIFSSMKFPSKRHPPFYIFSAVWLFVFLFCFFLILCWNSFLRVDVVAGRTTRIPDGRPFLVFGGAAATSHGLFDRFILRTSWFLVWYYPSLLFLYVCACVFSTFFSFESRICFFFIPRTQNKWNGRGNFPLASPRVLLLIRMNDGSSY